MPHAAERELCGKTVQDLRWRRPAARTWTKQNLSFFDLRTFFFTPFIFIPHNSSFNPVIARLH